MQTVNHHLFLPPTLSSLSNCSLSFSSSSSLLCACVPAPPSVWPGPPPASLLTSVCFQLSCLTFSSNTHREEQHFTLLQVRSIWLIVSQHLMIHFHSAAKNAQISFNFMKLLFVKLRNKCNKVKKQHCWHAGYMMRPNLKVKELFRYFHS